MSREAVHVTGVERRMKKRPDTPARQLLDSVQGLERPSRIPGNMHHRGFSTDPKSAGIGGVEQDIPHPLIRKAHDFRTASRVVSAVQTPSTQAAADVGYLRVLGVHGDRSHRVAVQRPPYQLEATRGPPRDQEAVFGAQIDQTGVHDVSARSLSGRGRQASIGVPV